MITKDIILCMVIYAIGNLAVWFQMNAQFKWDFWKDNWVLAAALGVPISVGFYYATKLSYSGFGGVLWPGRLVAFGISMIIFTVCTYFYLGESLTLRTVLSLVLSIVIVLLQLVK
tara:strand:- start:4791 stop:5135 length:345 start_codon:yes stop_codon:yes gene_type:complete